jgi:hypothetical protein
VVESITIKISKIANINGLHCICDFRGNVNPGSDEAPNEFVYLTHAQTQRLAICKGGLFDINIEPTSVSLR